MKIWGCREPTKRENGAKSKLLNFLKIEAGPETAGCPGGNVVGCRGKRLFLPWAECGVGSIHEQWSVNSSFGYAPPTLLTKAEP